MKSSILKTVTLLFWLLFAVSLIGLLPAGITYWVKIIGIFLLVAHTLEFVIFNKVIKAKGDSAVKAFFMTLVFGVVYFKF